MSAKRVSLLAALLVVMLSLVACVPKIPFLGAGAPSSSPIAATPTPAVPQPVATPAPIAAPAATPVIFAVRVNDPRGPYPEGEDPVLGTKHWGTRSDKVSGALGQATSNYEHQSVESYENALLMHQQADELLDVFKGSRGVRRIIEDYEGDPDSHETSYTVKEIDANEDFAGNDTPWVTATLRADFASPEGRRGLEMRVYRKKISAYKLDLTPYVSLTQVGYIDAEGELSRVPSYPAGYKPPTPGATDGLDTIRFKN